MLAQFVVATQLHIYNKVKVELHNVTLKTIKLRSSCISFGPIQEGMDSEQRLTISNTGRVWYSRYIVRGLDYHHLTERKQSAIDPQIAKELLDLIESNVDNLCCQLVTDIGTWEMTLVKEDGSITTARGSLIDYCGISERIHDALPFNNIIAFGYYEDEE